MNDGQRGDERLLSAFGWVRDRTPREAPALFLLSHPRGSDLVFVINLHETDKSLRNERVGGDTAAGSSEGRALCADDLGGNATVDEPEGGWSFGGWPSPGRESRGPSSGERIVGKGAPVMLEGWVHPHRRSAGDARRMGASQEEERR
jgi:hypothetical protein